MALPTPGTKFPSDEWAAAFDQYRANDAWYTGDQSKLQEVYGPLGGGNGYSRGDADVTHYNKGDGTRRAGGLRGILSRMFNGRIVNGGAGGENRTRIHAPVASNLASLSADLLIAEPPTFRLVGPDGETLSDPRQKRLDRIANSPTAHRVLSEGAELAAGLGAVVPTAHWDRSVSDAPWFGVTPCDAAIPEFVGGRLAAVNLFTMHIDQAGDVLSRVLFHVERHQPGAIVHALYRAKLDQPGYDVLADTVPLDTLAATAHIPTIPGSRKSADIENAVELPTGIDRLTAGWWRNRPTRTFRKNGTLAILGRSDYEGQEQMLDAIDEVWSSWMRDIKIARARLIVPESFLDLQGPGLGGKFDEDREVLTALNFVDLKDGETLSAHQFEIRADEHRDTLLALTKEVTQAAGYSLSTYGDYASGGSKTATEVVDDTTLTERTRDRKALYFREGLEPLTRALLDLDAAHYRGRTAGDVDLRIDFTELSQMDPEKEARMFTYLRTAMAVSTETLVRERNPTWGNDEVGKEVIRIQRENNLTTDEELDAAEVDRVDPTGADAVEPTEDPAADRELEGVAA